jgi:hypothetical protein
MQKPAPLGSYHEVNGLIGEEAIPNKGQGQDVILNSNCCSVEHRGVNLDGEPSTVAALGGLGCSHQDVEGQA